MSGRISVQFCFIYENIRYGDMVSTFTKQITSIFYESVYHLSPMRVLGKRVLHETANFRTDHEEAERVSRLVEQILGDADSKEEIEGGYLYRWHGQPYGYLMVCEVA
jgi:hypothetical protein